MIGRKPTSRKERANLAPRAGVQSSSPTKSLSQPPAVAVQDGVGVNGPVGNRKTTFAQTEGC
jgi:hypothetical protein